MDGNHIREQEVASRIQDTERHYEERLQAVQNLSVKLREEQVLQKAVKLIFEVLP